jgi:hypothetical protein
MDPKESFPAGIPHPSPSPPGNHGDGKLGVGEGVCPLTYQHFFVKFNLSVSLPETQKPIGNNSI